MLPVTGASGKHCRFGAEGWTAGKRRLLSVHQRDARAGLYSQRPVRAKRKNSVNSPGDPYLSAPSRHSPRSVYPKHEIKLRVRCFSLSEASRSPQPPAGSACAPPGRARRPPLTSAGLTEGGREAKLPGSPWGEPGTAFWEAQITGMASGKEKAGRGTAVATSQNRAALSCPRRLGLTISGTEISPGASKEKPWFGKNER